METFSALLAICAGNSPASGEFPAQRPVTRSFDVFFDLSLNKRLRKQSWGWWFETISRPLWRHRNETSHRKIRQCLCRRMCKIARFEFGYCTIVLQFVVKFQSFTIIQTSISHEIYLNVKGTHNLYKNHKWWCCNCLRIQSIYVSWEGTVSNNICKLYMLFWIPIDTERKE